MCAHVFACVLHASIHASVCVLACMCMCLCVCMCECVFVCVCTCVCTCVCLNVRVQYRCAHAITQGWRLKTASGISPYSPFCLGQRLWLFSVVYIRRAFPISASHLPIGVPGSQMLCYASSFYVGSGDLNSGPHTCAARTLPTKRSPQLSLHFFFLY